MGKRTSRAIQAVIEPIERRILLTGLDPTWGGTGTVTAPHGAAGDETAIVSVGVRSDGKVVVLTSEYIDPGYERTLIRYNPDGSIDTSFGDDGILALLGDFDEPSLSIMPDDRILLTLDRFGDEPLFEMRTAEGAVDASFGEEGRVALHHETPLEYLIGVSTAIAPNGDIYVSQSGMVIEDGTFTSDQTDVWRLNSDGSLDSAFSGDGHLRFNNRANYILTLVPNGDLWLSWSGVVHRITPDGTFEAEITEVQVGPREIIGVQSDGKILALASFHYELTARVARFNPDGTVDTTYGKDGYATSSGSLPDLNTDPNMHMVVDSEDRAVVFLTEWSTEKQRYVTHMVRFDTAGKQESLGPTDSLMLNVGGPGQVVVQPDGKILLVGWDYRISRITDDVIAQDIDLSGGILSVRGTASADTITVSRSGSNIVLSRNGTVTNYLADDVLEVIIDALDGNDVVTISADLAATIVARGGADTISTANASDYIRAGDGDDVITTAIGQDTVDGGAGNDSITCGDVATGLEEIASYDIDGAHSILGGDGNDTITCGAGEDRIDAGEGDNRMILGPGEDFIQTGDGDNYIESPEIFAYTGSGNDTIVSTGGDYYEECWLRDSGGNDSIFTGSGWDSIELSGGGKDTVQTADGRDAVQYTGGDAGAGIGLTVDLGDGNDGVHADVAISVIAGPDEWYWGDESDGIWVEHALGPIICGAGDDWVRTFHAATIYGGDGNDRIQTGGGRDFIYCGAGNDTVHAGNASDLISSGGGNDKLFGQGGKDRLYGGAGNDRLEGGGGDDRLVGAAGIDVIRGGSGIDTAMEDDQDTIEEIETLA